MAYRHT